MADWQVERGTKRCAITGEPFEPGEEYYSALSEEGDSFQRLDFSVAQWPEQEKAGFFSYWKTHMPLETDEPRRKFVDTEVIHQFFTRLEDADSPAKQTFRYLLCLILVRKRFLRLDDIAKGEDGEFLLVYDRRLEKDLRVYNPAPSPEELSQAQQELSCIFDMDFEEAGAPNTGVPAE